MWGLRADEVIASEGRKLAKAEGEALVSPDPPPAGPSGSASSSSSASASSAAAAAPSSTSDAAARGARASSTPAPTRAQRTRAYRPPASALPAYEEGLSVAEMRADIDTPFYGHNGRVQPDKYGRAYIAYTNHVATTKSGKSKQVSVWGACGFQCRTATQVANIKEADPEKPFHKICVVAFYRTKWQLVADLKHRDEHGEWPP